MPSPAIGREKIIGCARLCTSYQGFSDMQRIAIEAVATLVVPQWPSAPYWPMLCLDGTHLAGFVHSWL